MNFRFLLATIAASITMSGCSVIDPEENVPTYVHIDSISFKVNDPVKEGSASQRITAAWVYFNNQPVGVFDLPATIPILAEGAGQVSVIPGVVRNGLNDYHAQYPFFNIDTFSIPVKPGQVINFPAKTSYISSSQFQWKDGFEGGSSFTGKDPNVDTDTTIVRTAEKDKVFEGSGSGYIYMDATHPTSENITRDDFPISQGKSFLEINYKCNTSFQIGLQTTISGGVVVPEYIAGIKPSTEWKKLYVDLSQFTSEKKGTKFNVLIKAGLDDGLSTGFVLVDNIKVISF